jgi:excisionase family DNA binding protein
LTGNNEKNAPKTEEPPALPRLAYNIREVAEILGVSPATIRRWIKCGWLKCSWASRHKLIPRSEIERFLKDTLE